MRQMRHSPSDWQTGYEIQYNKYIRNDDVLTIVVGLILHTCTCTVYGYCCRFPLFYFLEKKLFICSLYPAGYYKFKVNIFFIVNFEHISHLVLVFLFLTLSR